MWAAVQPVMARLADLLLAARLVVSLQGHIAHRGKGSAERIGCGAVRAGYLPLFAEKPRASRAFHRGAEI